MKNFNIKSIILGIGIGTILTSIISMIYLAGLTPKMSKEEIISKAKEYGMVEGQGLLQSKTNEAENKEDSTKKAGSGISESKTQAEVTKAPAVSETKTENTEIVVSVKAGDTSVTVTKKLLDAGVIKDSAAFTKALSESGLAESINIGEYKLKKDADIKSIIKIITNTK